MRNDEVDAARAALPVKNLIAVRWGGWRSWFVKAGVRQAVTWLIVSEGLAIVCDCEEEVCSLAEDALYKYLRPRGP